jgi:hypothetical protein
MSENDPDQVQAKTLEEERMEDVLLMLQHLTRNEEVTIKMIVDCLYDIGSVNLINQKVPHRPINGIAKQIAKFSKPVVRITAYYWFRKNGPKLITKWLRSKVSFKKPVAHEMAETAHQVQATLEDKAVPETMPILEGSSLEGRSLRDGGIEIREIELYSQSKIELLTDEVQRLRTQLRLISGVSIGAIVALSGIILWMNYGRIETSAQQPERGFQMTTIEQD